ncbi:lysophospholipid acyltransferase family protein [soil metagenome]
MSDAFYNFLWFGGYPAFWVSSSPVVLHAERARRGGGFRRASNHSSPYDIPLLMRHTARKLDFVSIVEVFRNPFVAWLYGSMNAFPLDRHKPDSPTVRVILDRLERGRVVAMFPEGGFRKLEDSVVKGGKMRPGIGRLAEIANVPIMPVVVVRSGLYSRFTSWLPLKRTRYGVIYGEPLEIRTDLDKSAAAAEIEQRLREAFAKLFDEISAHPRMGAG